MSQEFRIEQTEITVEFLQCVYKIENIKQIILFLEKNLKMNNAFFKKLDDLNDIKRYDNTNVEEYKKFKSSLKNDIEDTDKKLFQMQKDNDLLIEEYNRFVTNIVDSREEKK